MSRKLPIYLDYMATTPLDPRVRRAMFPYLDRKANFGNPSSVHYYGQRARQAVEMAREKVAESVNADPREIIWTSGATEANNLALKGAANFYKRQGKHIITSSIEHKATLDCCKFLEEQGFSVTYINPDAKGHIAVEKIVEALRKDTILVSLMYVNNETGVINDIGMLAKVLREKGVLLHVDAAQAMGKIEVDVKECNADLISFSAHKVYGPKGIGALYVRRGVHLEPLMHGGGQEYGVRSGTLPTHQIVGMGKAFELAKTDLKKDVARILPLRDKLWEGLQKLPNVTLNGDLKQRVAHNLNVSFADIDGEELFFELSDIAISSGSACSAASVTPSHVLLAMGVAPKLAASSIRFSLGRFTTEREIDLVISHQLSVIRE